jgi:hypothetical protein
MSGACQKDERQISLTGGAVLRRHDYLQPQIAAIVTPRSNLGIRGLKEPNVRITHRPRQARNRRGQGLGPARSNIRELALLKSTFLVW